MNNILKRRNGLFLLSFHFLKTHSVIIYSIKKIGDKNIYVYKVLKMLKAKETYLFRNEFFRQSAIKLQITIHFKFIN